MRANRDAFVLKRPLDTRGRGVVIGREVPSASEWYAAVTHARRQGWLVQEFCTSTAVEADFDSRRFHNHDVSVGAINGAVAGALLRSSDELRMNVARTGRLHPVFWGR